MSGYSIKVDGLEKLLAKLDGSHLLAGPLRKALTKAIVLLEGEAKRRTPVDTGRLRSSITHSLSGDVVPLWGKVGSNVKYAPFVEHGTRPHWPPIKALERWAYLHKIPVFLVARAIARRGTKAHKMFAGALEASRAKIADFFGQAAKDIEGGWRK